MGRYATVAKAIGLIQGISHIVSGKIVTGKQALKLGLADAMVPSEFKHDALMTLIRAKQLKRKKLNDHLLKQCQFCDHLCFVNPKHPF